jgi:hypothetical protein
MRETTSTPIQFASCASKVELVEAVLCLMAAGGALIRPRGWIVAPLFALGAIWLFMRAHRDRSRPYVEVRDGQLVVRSSGTVSQHVDMRLLAGARRGWNKTILVLNDGTKVSIDHGLFATTAEASRFQKFVEETNGSRKA